MPDTIDVTLTTLRAQRHTGIEQAWSLPPVSYHCPDVHRLEVERIFQREWICVSHVHEIDSPGDYSIESLGANCSRVKWGLATRSDMTPDERAEVTAVYGNIIQEDRAIIERLQAALQSQHAARGRLSQLEQSAWDLYRYLGKQPLD